MSEMIVHRRITLQAAVDEFLFTNEVEGLADTTNDWYKSILGKFARQLPGKRVEDINKDDVKQFLYSLKKENYSEDSRGSYHRCLHRFWKWCSAEYNLINPMGNIRIPAKPRPKHRSAKIEDILKMYSVAGERDRAMIAFILDTGARAGGLCGLKMRDINLQTRTATVTEKGHKTRQVPFKEFTQRALEEWIKVRQPQVEYLFHALDSDENLLPNGLYQAFKRLARRAGVTGRFNPHSMRHAFSNAFYEAGEGKYLIELARIMGHADMRTLIENYVSRTDDHVRAAHDEFSPIDNFAALWEAEQKRVGQGGSDE